MQVLKSKNEKQNCQPAQGTHGCGPAPKRNVSCPMGEACAKARMQLLSWVLFWAVQPHSYRFDPSSILAERKRPEARACRSSSEDVYGELVRCSKKGPER